MNCRLTFSCTIKKAGMAVGVHVAVALGPWCSDWYPGMQGDTQRRGGKEKKTLDRLLHESAVE